MRRNQDQPTISGDRKLYLRVVRVALPIAMQSLLSSSLSLVDNLLVGHLGETELSSVGLSTQIGFIFWMVLFGFCSGTITYMSQFYGKRDFANIRRVTGIAITVCFIVGLAFFFMSLLFPRLVISVFTNIPEVIDMGEPFVRYSCFIFLFWSITVPLTASLRATQQTSLPLKISIAALALNTTLCLLFIYGFFGLPKMGIMGACLATIISRFVELSLYIFVIFGRKNVVAGKIQEFFSYDKFLFRKVLSNAVPTTLNETFWGIGNSMYAAAVGRIGVVAFAAYQAANTIQNLFSLFCFAVGDAMIILVGEQLGKGDFERAAHYASRILRLTVPLGIIAGVLLSSSSHFIVQLFNLSDKGMWYAQIILIIFSFMLFVKIFNVALITGALRAGGDTKFAATAELSCVWCIGVPLGFVLALVTKSPVWLVVLAIQFEEVVKFFVLFLRYRSGKWIRNLVDVIEDEQQGK